MPVKESRIHARSLSERTAEFPSPGPCAAPDGHVCMQTDRQTVSQSVCYTWKCIKTDRQTEKYAYEYKHTSYMNVSAKWGVRYCDAKEEKSRLKQRGARAPINNVLSVCLLSLSTVTGKRTHTHTHTHVHNTQGNLCTYCTQ